LLTRWLDGRSLQRYAAFLVALCVLLAASGYWLAPNATLTGSAPTRAPDLLADATVLLLIIGAVATVVWHRQRLIALVVLGVVGLMVSLTFIRFSAPDLALTQLSVEVVTIVLMLLALYFLPRETPIESHWLRRARDGGLAVIAGTGTGLLSWAVLTRPHETISGYFLTESVPGGGGTNVVNVILVDFRGFDTLGEITVLAMAAIGVHAMLEGLRLKLPTLGWDGKPWARTAHPLFLAVLSRVILPLALVVALYVLLRGHNQPGGGFIAGLVTGVALILQYLGNGIAWTQERFVVRYHITFALGLFIATAAGLGSWWFDRPFLTSAHGHLHLPLIGDLHLASAMIFDIGVYVTVVGAVLLILAEIGRLSVAQSERALRVAPETSDQAAGERA
jgi:multicomponent K+:H+ antiporter subunit A